MTTGSTPSNMFLQRLIGAAALDAAIYEEVEDDQTATGQAMAVVLLSSIAAAVCAPAFGSSFTSTPSFGVEAPGDGGARAAGVELRRHGEGCGGVSRGRDSRRCQGGRLRYFSGACGLVAMGDGVGTRAEGAPPGKSKSGGGIEPRVRRSLL